MTTPPNSSNAPDLPGTPGHSTAERRAILAGLGGLAAGAFLAGRAQAGPLNPPAGPVASTGKTLTDVEPRIAINATNTPGDAQSVFRISQSGSYYLTGNVIGASGKNGILIATSNVTIDLNGFTLFGVTGSLHGIARNANLNSGIRIHNGTISGWGLDGINLPLNGSGETRGFHYDSIICRDNGGVGFWIGDGSVLTRCVSAGNDSHGFAANNNVRFSDCVANANGGNGFSGGFGCSFAGCIARANTGSGFAPTSNSVFLNCSSSNSSQGSGFVLIRSVAIGCESTFNFVRGFLASNQSTLDTCVAINNDIGIEVSSNSSIINCNVVGVSVGISVTGSDNRIDGNNVVDSSTGISISSAGNLVIRNSVSGGTRYSIAAGNSVGPITTAANIATLTNPAANFDY